jgi:hypothetical protein
VQERNIEKLCHCRVLDRATLILDIFAQRAQSYEGKLPPLYPPGAGLVSPGKAKRRYRFARPW